MSSDEKGAKDAKESSAKDAKPAGKSPGLPWEKWAAVVAVILIAWVVIHVAQAHSMRKAAYLCTFDSLREYTLARNADGLARISNNCAGSRVAGEARRTLWDWASADWRRASSRNTADGYQEFCSVWKRYELTGKYYDCSPSMRDGRLSISYRESGPHAYRRLSGGAGGQYVAQVYNGTTRDSAEAYSDALKRRHGALLSGFTVAAVETGPRGYGQHKVLIGPMASKHDADALCMELKTRNVDCFSKATADALD